MLHRSSASFEVCFPSRGSRSRPRVQEYNSAHAMASGFAGCSPDVINIEGRAGERPEAEDYW